MSRVRTDGVFGTLTDNPLTNVATTMNSAGLANLAAVSGDERAVIILDPNRVHGAPEIVNVSVHTAAANVATIVRARFGTAAREHPAGTEWVHGPIAGLAAESLATGVTGQGDFVPMGPWELWTPTLANLTVGSGTLLAWFARSGRAIDFYIRFLFSTGSAVGTNPTFTLPVAPHARYSFGGLDVLGICSILDNGVGVFGGPVFWGTGNTIQPQFWGTAGAAATASSITATAPMTWTTGDRLIVAGRYEALI